MIDEQLEEAQILIQQERYDEARRLLERINHPTAREWLDFINTYAMSIAIADMKCPVCGAAKFTDGQISAYGGVTYITGKLKLNDDSSIPARHCDNCGYVMLFINR